MMRRLLALAVAASLSACATTDATRLKRADAMLARVEAGYAAARGIAALFAPWLPPDRAARLRALGHAADLALAAARAAVGAAARHEAAREAEAATQAFRLAAGA